MINKNNVPVSAFQITALFAFLFDIVILENLGWVRSAGTFIKNNLENTEHPVVRWESDFIQLGGSWSCYSVLGYFLGVWIMAPILFLASFLFEYNTEDKAQMFLFVVGIYLSTYTFYLIIRHLGSNISIEMLGKNLPLLNNLECDEQVGYIPLTIIT